MNSRNKKRIKTINPSTEQIIQEYANDSKFGLGTSIWMTDLEKAESLPRLVESGIITLNNIVASDPRVPFDGVKKSGFGRELSRYGILEFTNVKSVRLYEELVSKHLVE